MPAGISSSTASVTPVVVGKAAVLDHAQAGFSLYGVGPQSGVFSNASRLRGGGDHACAASQRLAENFSAIIKLPYPIAISAMTSPTAGAI